MDPDDVADAIHEAARFAAMAASPFEPPPDLDPAIYAQIAHTWALVALARAITIHADHSAPA